MGGGSRESRALGQLGERKPGELSPCLTSRERELREQVEDMGDPPGSEEGEEIEEDRCLCPAAGGGLGVEVALAHLVAVRGRAVLSNSSAKTASQVRIVGQRLKEDLKYSEVDRGARGVRRGRLRAGQITQEAEGPAPERVGIKGDEVAGGSKEPQVLAQGAIG